MVSCRARFTLAVLLLAAALTVPASAGTWPQWRGPDGNSVSKEKALPLEWADNKNLAWKCQLLGPGASTPAIWNDAIFVTCQKDQDLLLLKVGKDNGKVVWQRTVGTGRVPRAWPEARGRQKFHALQNFASPSPVTDGRRVFVHFGNGALAAYDFAGNRLWRRNLQKDYGRYTIWWGHANSPVLYRDLVICVCMQDSLKDLGQGPVDSYLAAYDQKTGALRWKTLRNTKATAEECDAYTTPVFRRSGGRTELLVMGANQLDAYDPATGKQHWFLPGLSGNRTITGPTVAGGMVYATCGMRRDLVAVRPGESGQLPPASVVWRTKEATPDSPCPVVYRGMLFVVSDNGIARCLDAVTGHVKWKERLAGDYKASPLAADGYIYFLSRDGRCTVVTAAAKFAKVAENRLADQFVASPAVSGGKLFLRGQKALYCLGKTSRRIERNGAGPRSQNQP
jgi:outer membrane protein assembly factor BamB